MVIGFIIKSSLVVGAVYYSRELGVWGSSKQTEKLYNQIKEEIRPHAQRLAKQLPFDVPALPQSGEARYLAKHYYNNGVKSTFHFIEMLPCYTGQLVKKTKDAINEFTQSQAAGKKTDEPKK